MPSRIFQRAVLATAIAAAIAIASAPVDAATVDPFAASPPEAADRQDAEPAQDSGTSGQSRDEDRSANAGANPPAPTPAQPAAAGPPSPAPAAGSGAGNGNPGGNPGANNSPTISPNNPAPHDCPLSLDAAPFLRAATERGIQPKVVAGSACDMNPINNEFFGRGGEVDCKLQFGNARWLRDDMRFTDITGVGSFEAKVTASGIEVSIPADGGVRFRRVSVQAKVKAGAGCPAAKPASVLAD